MANEVGINVLRSSKGARVRAGDVLGVLYSGSLLDGDGAPFDANYDFATFSAIPARQLFTFELGGAQVIQGWDQALAGRRLGEVLDLTIPSELAYGSAGAPPSIPPNAPLRFRVELVGSIPAGESEPVYPSYSELGLGKKLFKQLKAAKPKVADRKIGTDAADLLTGGASEDLLIGLGGEDVLQGNGQPDVLIGGPGGSRYVYTDLNDSPARRGRQDRILGFQSSSDSIDLSLLGDSLVYIGKRAFSQTAGEVRFAKGSLLLDHDGDGRAELEILLTGVKRFSGGSLVL